MQMIIAMQTGQPKFADLVTMMNTAKQEQGPSSLDAVLKLLDVFQDKLGGNPRENPDGSTSLDAIKEVLPAARPILENLAQQRAQAQQAAQQPMVVTTVSPLTLPGVSATASAGRPSNGSPAQAPTSSPAEDADMWNLILAVSDPQV